MNLNGLNLLKGGTSVAVELEKVDIDPKVKREIYELANNQQMLGKKINECIDCIVMLSDVLNTLLGITEKIENKMYKKEHQYKEENISEV